jgi:hypothetical protein
MMFHFVELCPRAQCVSALTSIIFRRIMNVCKYKEACNARASESSLLAGLTQQLRQIPVCI